MYKQQKALKNADTDLRDLQEDKVASERLITRIVAELAESRLAAENERHKLQCEVVALRRDLARRSAEADELTSRLAESTEAEQLMRNTLDVTQLELSALTTLYPSVQDHATILQGQSDAICPSFDLDQQTEKIFEAHLLDLHHSYEHRLDEVADGSVLDVDTMVRELERELCMGPGQQASDSLQVELQKCFVTEWDQVWKGRDTNASMQQHQQARLDAEKARDDVASQLQETLTQVTQLTAVVQQEQDTASKYCSDLLEASDAHLRTMEEWVNLPLRTEDTVKQRDEIEQKLRNAEAELQASQEDQKVLRTANEALSMNIKEKVNLLSALELQSCLRITVDQTQALKRTTSVRSKAKHAANKENEGSFAQVCPA